MSKHFRRAAAPLLGISLAGASPPQDTLRLQGTWEMDSAYEIQADGTRVTGYGEHPVGLLMIDAQGRYTIVDKQ